MTDPAGHGVHDYEDDPRNDTVLVMVNGALTHGPRPWCRCSTPGSCSATGCGRGFGCTAATPCSSTGTSTGSSRGPRRWRSTSA